MSAHFLLQGIFLIQGSNPHFLLGRWILYNCTTREAPKESLQHCKWLKVPWLSHHIASEDCPGSSGQRFPISLTWNWGFDVRVFKRCWDFPGSPVVKTLPSNVPGVGLVPGQGAKIPHALRPKKPKIKQKQYWNKFNNDFKNDPHKRKVSKKLLLCTC